MSETILVCGHKNPDNDSICSAVAAANMHNIIAERERDRYTEENFPVYKAVRLGPLPPESAWVLAQQGVEPPELIERIEPGQKIVLVDHNEPQQSVDGIEEADIVEVVDHHRVAGLTTSNPVKMVFMTWGCTATILTKMYEAYHVPITQHMATIMLSAILTDTVITKSPTTTDVDRAVAAALGEQLGVDPVKFGMEVFLSRPSGSFTAEQMVGNDIKLFEVAGKKLLIGQYETVDKSRALGMVDEIRAAMRAYQAEKGADGIVLCVTDIMEEGSQVLLEGDTVAAQKGLGIEDVPEGIWCPGVLSRKKQVAAPILAAN